MQKQIKAFKMIMVQPSQQDLVTSSPSPPAMQSENTQTSLDFFVIYQDYDSESGRSVTVKRDSYWLLSSEVEAAKAPAVAIFHVKEEATKRWIHTALPQGPLWAALQL